MRRFLAGFIVFCVAWTPAADAYCRAGCRTPALAPAAAEEHGGHCKLLKPSQDGAAVSPGSGSCANPHAETRVLQAAIKIERAAFAATAPQAVASPLPAILARPALERSLDQHPLSSAPARSIPLRC